jgi:peptidoglycan/xylan/chitin deacetylase (PgdA/CDA1 family)
VQGDPSQALALQRDGHELGNHTWSHQPMRRLSASAARTEVRKGRDELTQALGGAGWWFRPSGTPHSTATIRSAARAAGYPRWVSYDVGPHGRPSGPSPGRTRWATPATCADPGRGPRQGSEGLAGSRSHVSKNAPRSWLDTSSKTRWKSSVVAVLPW